MSKEAALTIHLEQLATHGGEVGTRDEGLLDSALARPQNLISYGESDAAALAANYGFGIPRDRSFIDGKKRTALVVCEFFLAKNALAIDATNAEMVAVFLDLASGEISEAELAAWLRERVTAS